MPKHQITKPYTCLKDWIIESGTYYEKGKTYTGKPYNNGQSVEMRGEAGMKVHFHAGSEYFQID